MKQCPRCKRDYYDETLSFCLDDGIRLTESARPISEGITAMLPTFDANVGAAMQSDPRGYIATPPDNAIAVLPFVNMSRGQDIEYFSDGLAEELLNVLSKIRGLRVAARSSAFSFKGRPTNIEEIGRTLRVASVLEGSIRMAGDRMRISVQLVKVSDGYQLWSETYDRTMDDIFAIQDDIARSVVEEIRARLLDESIYPDTEQRIASEVAAAVKGRADDPEAQRLMLLGRHFLDRTTREDTAKAIGYFREAIDIDPEFALCWAELGRAYSIEAGRSWIPTTEGFARSREATLRALSLEPNLAEGHAQLGRIQAVYDWDFAGAEGSYRRALELAPGSSSVLDGASVLAYKLGRLGEAMELCRRVLDQDPLSPSFWHNLGLVSNAAGDLDESAKAYRRALELSPLRFVSHALLSQVLMELGRTPEAFEAAHAEPDDFWQLWALAILHHLSGSAEEAETELQRLIAEYADGNAYQIAEVLAVHNKNDEAFEWLERANGERDAGVTHAKVNRRFCALHSDPRWQTLLSKIGFET